MSRYRKNFRLSHLLLAVAVATTPPILYFINQAQRGHPVDIHYFLAWFSPSNGSGGSDWKIGPPLVHFWDSYNTRSLSEVRAFALQLINRDRTLNGLGTLVEDPLLSQAAQQHAEDMLKRQYFDHISPEGHTPSDRYYAVGGNRALGVGENIALDKQRFSYLNYQILEENQKGWMYSNGHRENILVPDYSRFGYGIVTDPVTERTYAVQEFAADLYR